MPDGGFALAGWTTKISAGNFNLNFWLVRTDADGNLLWDKDYDGGADDFANAIVTLPDGGFALAGFTFSKGAGEKDFWLVRTDDDGNLLWDKTYGGTGYDGVSSLVALPDGGFALAGYYTGNIVWLIRTDAEGNSTCK